MTDGLERRYRVERLRDWDGKHKRCWYFVLDPLHDEHARTALRAYAYAVEATHPQLAAELRLEAVKAEKGGAK